MNYLTCFRKTCKKLIGLCFLPTFPTNFVLCLNTEVKCFSKLRMGRFTCCQHIWQIALYIAEKVVVRELARMHLKWWIVSRCSSPLQAAINLEPAWARDKSFVQWTNLLLTITHLWLSLSWVDDNMSFFPPGKPLELPFLEQKNPKSLPLTTFQQRWKQEVDQLSVILIV